MCYDISYQITLDSLEEYFGDIIIDDPQLEIDFDMGMHVIGHGYAKQRIVTFENGTYRGNRSEWGLISRGMNTTEKIAKRRAWMLNAKSEKIVDDAYSAWYPFRHQRCLVPVKGIFEHREIAGWKNKVPYYIRLKDRDMFCIPGLWSYSPLPNPETGEAIMTHTIITREAPEGHIIRQIHNGGGAEDKWRMLLFLPKSLESEWLDPNLTDDGMREIFNYAMPSNEFIYHPVWSIRTSKPHPTGGCKIDPYDWPALPPLGNDGSVQKTLF